MLESSAANRISSGPLRLLFIKLQIATLGSWLALGGLPAMAQSASTRLDRTNLLLYHGPSGNVRTAKTEADWEIRRSEILAAMQSVMGLLPGKEKRCPLEVSIQETNDCGSFIRQLLTYVSEPGSRVPAYLLIPKKALPGSVRLPAILSLHPTDNVHGFGVTIGIGAASQPAYGRELAERGYVVLAPAYPLLAKYQPDLKKLGYQSGTMKAIWDNIRGVDLLQSLPCVDRGRIAAIGHSLGGHNAIFTAVFEPRIKVIVSSCGFDSFLDYHQGDIAGWTSDRYMPKLSSFAPQDIPFDFHEMVGALAPRPFFVSAPKVDENFNWQSVEAVTAAASVIYRLKHAENHLRVEHPDCQHAFPEATRQRAYEFLDHALGR